MVFCNKILKKATDTITGHNPYFNRWFSAMNSRFTQETYADEVTILILIDGFLQ